MSCAVDNKESECFLVLSALVFQPGTWSPQVDFSPKKSVLQLLLEQRAALCWCISNHLSLLHLLHAIIPPCKRLTKIPRDFTCGKNMDKMRKLQYLDLYEKSVYLKFE